MNSADDSLMQLIRAIAAGKLAIALRQLADNPELATASLVKRGATRQSPGPHYFEAIGHYVYAGDTALHIAAAAYSLEVARRLILLHARVSATNRRGAQPLHYAADGAPGSAHWNPKAQMQVIRRLVAAGANPNAVDKNGVSPLHRAVRTRCSGAVQALLECGADPTLCNANGSTPRNLASKATGRGGSGSVEAKQEQIRILRLLDAAR